MASASGAPSTTEARGPAPPPRTLVVAVGGATFLGAFLLFQVQPLIGKALLPWFGGVPAVWTTAILVFQALLVAGYALVHGATRLLRPATRSYLVLATAVA